MAVCHKGKLPDSVIARNSRECDGPATGPSRDWTHGTSVTGHHAASPTDVILAAAVENLESFDDVRAVNDLLADGEEDALKQRNDALRHDRRCLILLTIAFTIMVAPSGAVLSQNLPPKWLAGLKAKKPDA